MKKVSNRFKNKHVLVLEGYCKQSLPFIRGFKEQGCKVSVLCVSKLDCGYASRLPDHKILGMCDPHEYEKSEEYIKDLVKNGDYDMVFAPFDFSARILSHNKEELSKYAIIYANDKDIFDAANNKEVVMKVCMDNNIPCPKTYFDISSVDDLKSKDIKYPIIIKPHSMYGARGFHMFNTQSDFKEYVINMHINLADYVIQEYMPEGSRVMGGNVFVDHEGKIKSSYLYICEHLYPEVGGTSTLNAIYLSETIKKDCERLVKLMNLQGEIGVDLMLDVRDNVGKVIEINPRPVHGIALGFFCGVNHALQILEDAFGYEVTDMQITKTDTPSRIGQTDLLWFLKSPDRFRRSRKRLGYKHVKEQMFFWDDPLPWFAYLLQGLKNYKKIMKEKTK